MAAERQEDFIFELYTEEIPASYQKGAFLYLAETLPKLLNQEALNYQDLKVFATSRRIGFYLEGLRELQEKTKKILKGPSRDLCFLEGVPTKALLGFAEKAGISWQEVRFISQGQKEYAQAEVEHGGRHFSEVLANLLNQIISQTPFPKTMRWGDGDLTYARPILGYFAMYGDEIISFSSVSSARIWEKIKAQKGVRGHFLLNKETYSLKSAKDYFHFLEKNGIYALPEKRKNYIEKTLQKKAHELNLKLIPNDDLLEEVNYLVESPQVFVGEFPKHYLKLPPCVILSEMQSHQRYFALEEENGGLSANFLIVANTPQKDPELEKNIIEGNVRVLKARLEDGRFYYEEDRKSPLWEKVPNLKKIQFLENLGTMYDKAMRIKNHAQTLQKHGVFPDIPESIIERAALLSKADLSTKLVYEFDHLQGEIGSIYARLDNESEEIVRAIYEHYLPRHQKDHYPKTPLGILLSLADKLDNLIAGFLTRNEPTANTDPLGLRRQTLYLIDILLQNNLSFSFKKLLTQLLVHFANMVSWPKELEAKIWDFVRNRLFTIFEKEGFSQELIRAGIYSATDDLYDLYLRISAIKKLKELGNEETFSALLISFKRMRNILNDFNHKFPNEKIPLFVKEELFEQNEEKNLFKFVKEWEKLFENLAKEKNYYELFSFLAHNKPTVDLFFDKVMVMHENLDLRNNRLALLQQITTKIQNLLDLSYIGK